MFRPIGRYRSPKHDIHRLLEPDHAIRNAAECIPIRRLTGIVDSDDGLGPWRYAYVDILGIDQQRVAAHIGDYGRPALIADAVGGGHEGHRRHDDFITGSTNHAWRCHRAAVPC